METIINLLVIALMWGGFILLRKRPEINKNEFYVYLAAMIFVCLLTGFYYSFYQFLLTGFAMATGAVFGVGWNRHIEEQ